MAVASHGDGLSVCPGSVPFEKRRVETRGAPVYWGMKDNDVL